MIQYLKLGSLTRIRTGKLDANAANDGGIYPFFTCSKEPLSINTYSYDCECVLVAGNGDLNVKYYDGKFDAYQRTYIIESLDKTNLMVKYLYCFLDLYVETLRQQAIGGVIKYIKLGNLTEAIIPIPPIEKQREIVDIFEKCNGTIAYRQQELELMDYLVKSQFIEMFGDPNFSRDTVPFEVAFTIRDDLRKPINDAVRAEMHDGATYPYYGANGQVDTINQYLMDCTALCLAEDCGAYGPGEPSSYIVQGKCWVNNHAHVIIPNDNCDFHYANAFFRILDMRPYVSGSTRLKLTQGKMKKIPVVLPSLDEQRQFASFIEQSDKSKFEIQKILEKLEILKKALMQKYFG